jgi:hypothetical protein
LSNFADYDGLYPYSLVHGFANQGILYSWFKKLKRKFL